MADDIVLMDQGKIVQQSNPRELYNNPNCIYTAQFVGSPQTNILDGFLPEGLKLGFRPEKVRMQPMAQEDGLTIPAKIQTKEMLGAESIYSLNTPFGVIMCKSEADVDDGAAVQVGVSFRDMLLFGTDTMRVPFGQAEQKAVAAALGRRA